MNATTSMKRPVKRGFAAFVRRIIQPEKSFYQAALAYGSAVSLLMLVGPVAVQMVINTVANTAQQFSLLIVCSLLVGILSLASILYALQNYTMELFRRRFFARCMAEIAVTVTDMQQRYQQKLNSHELIQRFYEVMDVLKMVPTLVISGFALAMQIFLGLIVVSFYHPFLLAFNLAFVLLCFLAWYWWHRGARDSARKLSYAKYSVGAWLGTMAQQADLPATPERLQALWTQTDHYTHQFVTAQKTFFRYSFAQTIGFLSIFVLGSTGLLGLGGWLVISNQLTLGQLVAAELILSYVFYGVIRFGYFLSLYYELCVAGEKLDGLLNDPEHVLGVVVEPHGVNHD